MSNRPSYGGERPIHGLFIIAGPTFVRTIRNIGRRISRKKVNDCRVPIFDRAGEQHEPLHSPTPELGF